MTIYIPSIRELPLGPLSSLGPGARFSTSETDGSVAALVYEWDDVKVVANVLPADELAAHLEGFVGWVHSVCRAQGRPPDESVVRRIQSTTLVLGFVVEGAQDRDVWHERVEDIVGTICYNTGALLFWEDALFDENARQIVPAA